MRIVITGALGHIGSYLLRSLPEQFKELEIIAMRLTCDSTILLDI